MRVECCGYKNYCSYRPDSLGDMWNGRTTALLLKARTNTARQQCPKRAAATAVIGCSWCLLAPVALHEGERGVVPELSCVVKWKRGRSIDVKRKSIRLETSRAAHLSKQKTYTDVCYLLLLRGGPATVGVDPAVHLAGGGACGAGMYVCACGGERRCLTVCAYIHPFRYMYMKTSIVNVHVRAYAVHTSTPARTGDGLHDALDDNRLEVVLAPADLLRLCFD